MRTRFSILHSLFALAFFACASQAPKVTLPEWTSIPAGVIDALCSRLHNEGISSEQTLNIVSTTQPLLTSDSMAALADSTMYQGRIDPAEAAELASQGLRSLPVKTGSRECNWRPIDAAARRNENDTMTVEVSAPFINPFGRNSAGVIARMSLGGEAPMWYWIPIGRRGEVWAAGMPLPLATRR